MIIGEDIAIEGILYDGQTNSIIARLEEASVNYPNYDVSTNVIENKTFSASFDCDDIVLHQAIENSIRTQPMSFGFVVDAKVPIRRHKKKRINKKWNKRYGVRYQIVSATSEGWVPIGVSDNTYEFTNDKAEVQCQ